MAGIASPLPISVMTHQLGLPDEPEKFRRLGSTIAGGLDGIYSLGQARMLAAADAELRDTFNDLLTRRATEPGDDLVSALVAEQGNKITAEELAPLVRLLLIAGFETTVNAIGNGMRWLLADREQPGGVDGADPRGRQRSPRRCRFARPYSRPRGSLTEIEVGGVTLRKNEVITILAAAGRDPRSIPILAVLTSPGTHPPSTLRSQAASITASARRSPGWSWPRPSGPG
jgi:cytochrome P450